MRPQVEGGMNDECRRGFCQTDQTPKNDVGELELNTGALKLFITTKLVPVIFCWHLKLSYPDSATAVKISRREQRYPFFVFQNLKFH